MFEFAFEFEFVLLFELLFVAELELSLLTDTRVGRLGVGTALATAPLPPSTKLAERPTCHW